MIFGYILKYIIFPFNQFQFLCWGSCSGPCTSSQVKSGQVGSAQVRSGHIRSGQVRSRQFSSEPAGCWGSCSGPCSPSRRGDSLWRRDSRVLSPASKRGPRRACRSPEAPTSRPARCHSENDPASYSRCACWDGGGGGEMTIKRYIYIV